MENLSNVMKIQKELARKKHRTFIILYIVLVAILGGLSYLMTLDGDMGVLVVPGVLLLLFTLFIVFMYTRTIGVHPSLQSLSAEEQKRVNEDVETGYRFGNIIVCRDGLLMALQKMQLVPYCDIVFVYGQNTTYTATVVAIATTSSIMVATRDRKQYAINVNISPFYGQGNNAFQTIDAQKMFEVLRQSAPWSFFGASPENMKLFTKDFKRMVAEVDARK